MDRYFSCGGESRECSRMKEQHEPKPGSERLPSSGEFLLWKITLILSKVGIRQRFFSGDYTFVSTRSLEGNGFD